MYKKKPGKFQVEICRVMGCVSDGTAKSHIVMPDGLLLCVFVLILILTGQGRLPICFCFPYLFGVGLTVF